MKKSRIQVFVLAMCCVAGPAYAGTAWPSSISKLCAASDLVVVGRVTRDSADPFATVNVNRTLKGQDAPGEVISVSLPQYMPLRAEHDEVVTSGVAFLSHADGMWQVLPCSMAVRRLKMLFPRSASRTRSVRQYVMRGQSCYRGGRGPHG